MTLQLCTMISTRSKNLTGLVLWLGIMAMGCRSVHYVRDPEYGLVSDTMARAWNAPDPVPDALSPVGTQLQGAHPVEDYIAFALAQNPDVQAARKQIEVMAHRVPQAASLEDPTLNVMSFPFFPNVPQTASGRARVEITAAQKFPWFGKLRRQAEAAEAEVDMARAELAAAELETIQNVKQAYYELYYVQQAIRITQTERRLLVDLASIAEIQFKTAKTSQQDVLRAQVEVSSVDTELIRLRQELASAQARLARVLHVSPQTNLQASDQLPSESIPADVQRLYVQSVAARPELHAQLAALVRDRASVELARLQYVPDTEVSFGWGDMTTSQAISPVADGIDDLTLGFMVNVPVYRKRLDSAVREAEAQAVTTARKYDSVRDETFEQVTDLFARVVSQQEMLELLRTDILPRSRQTLEVSIPGYQVGQVDFLQLLDNWRTLLRFELSYHRLESQLRQSLAELERIAGGVARTQPET
jgi:outer membrane protein TolC